MPEENNKREKNGENNNKVSNNKETKELNNIKELKDFRDSSIKNNSNGAKKDISYSEYYRIKTGIELSRVLGL